MAIYKIIEVPDPILKKTAQPVKKINAGVLRVLDNLRDTMYDANGVCLSRGNKNRKSKFCRL